MLVLHSMAYKDHTQIDLAIYSGYFYYYFVDIDCSLNFSISGTVVLFY